MKSAIKILIFILVAALLLSGCSKKEEILPEELTGGFWMEDVTGGLLLSFGKDGTIGHYIYREHPSEGIYYACLDPAWAQYNKYLIDTENYMIFIMPDGWYSIQLLNDSDMMLSDGENGYDFYKVWENEELVVVDYDEF